MWRATAPRFQLIAAIAAGAIGCTTRATSSASSGAAISSSAGSSTGGAATGSSGGTTQGSASGTASTSATGGSAGTTGTSTGTTTGSPFVDGGYVFCFLASAADAGPTGDGGSAAWLCPPGTYFCDLGGEIGGCTQCRSDQDCANQDLPTYDPLRLRCDLDSGVAGYQDFCQECLADSDCAGNAAGSLCDLSPTYPLNALEPSIEALGFETCGYIQSDCRLEGGPLCLTSNQICDPLNGQCEDRPAGCSTDQDCAGMLTASPSSSEMGSPYLPTPYCVSGICNACAGGVCPNNHACESDADCGNPTSSPSGLRCGLFDGGRECVCTDSSQCGGFWPACTGLDAGNINDAGQPLGICSCDSDAECGDGGLACLPPQELSPFPPSGDFSDPPWPPFLLTIFGAQAGSSFCGVPCTSPDFPSCAALAGVDTCDLTTRVCDWCLTDEQCTYSVGAGGPDCDGPLISGPPMMPPGNCGCVQDADCPAGDRCLSEGSHSSLLGICTASLSRCTPESCGGFYCNWDSGACVNISDFETLPSCVSDADCSEKVCWEGACVDCRDPARCTPAGQTNNQPCLSAADCPDDEGCNGASHVCGTCRGPTARGGPYDCPPDAICSNYWLGSLGACLPNCDRESCPASRPICAALPSLTPDHKYCFGCLQDSDCGDAGSWCDQSFNRTFTCQPAGT